MTEKAQKTSRTDLLPDSQAGNRIPRIINHAVISGATGMIGAHLTRLLLSRGIRVTALVRPGSKKLDNLPQESEFLRIVPCDIKDIRTLETDPADAFFHLAWSGTEGSTRNDETAQRENVGLTLEALHKAKELGCSVFLGAGSQAEYGFFEGELKPDTPMDPVTWYGKAKKEAEEKSRKEAEGLGIDHLWVRILSVYGPGDNAYSLVMQAIHAFLKHEPVAFTKGEQVWDYLYAGDCAEALLALALYGKNGSAYPLGKGEKVLLKDYIAMIRDAVDKDIPLNLGGRPYNDHQVMYLTADMSALYNDTGYRPETPFTEGIKKTVSWVRENSL